MRILAIETSCDETAAAIVEKNSREQFVRVVTGVVASQAKLHEKYGGVYPEVASREHVRTILPVIAETLGLPMLRSHRLPPSRFNSIDYIAVTHGPGLIGSLLVGTQTASAISYATKIPLLAVNHLAGHIYASFILPEPTDSTSDWLLPRFPLVALVVSGGHTFLVYMESHHHYHLIGQTRDDAAGEAFDKIAKLLHLGYPGGPLISRLARRGNRHAYNFPIGLEHDTSLDFSFSGLKTAVLRETRSIEKITNTISADIAASFERAVVEALLLKVSLALNAFPVRDFVLGGGVAANDYLRSRLAALLAHRTPAVTLHVPPGQLCTDNAQAIAAAAAFSDLKPVDPANIQTYARLPLTD